MNLQQACIVRLQASCILLALGVQLPQPVDVLLAIGQLLHPHSQRAVGLAQSQHLGAQPAHAVNLLLQPFVVGLHHLQLCAQCLLNRLGIAPTVEILHEALIVCPQTLDLSRLSQRLGLQLGVLLLVELQAASLGVQQHAPVAEPVLALHLLQQSPVRLRQHLELHAPGSALICDLVALLHHLRPQLGGLVVGAVDERVHVLSGALLRHCCLERRQLDVLRVKLRLQILQHLHRHVGRAASRGLLQPPAQAHHLALEELDFVVGGGELGARRAGRLRLHLQRRHHLPQLLQSGVSLVHRLLRGDAQRPLRVVHLIQRLHLRPRRALGGGVVEQHLLHVILQCLVRLLPLGQLRARALFRLLNLKQLQL
mmetsp:Transcript_38976/g.74644  ORF Transcript_38976/g.74644 Transcript_38976/m.74644 type:complete len:368 (-) Transcript_38976:165-1268(-)